MKVQIMDIFYTMLKTKVKKKLKEELIKLYIIVQIKDQRVRRVLLQEAEQIKVL